MYPFSRMLAAASAVIFSLSLQAAQVATNPNGSGNLVFQPSNQDVDILQVVDSGVAWSYSLFMFDETATLTDYDPNAATFINDQSILAIDPVPMQIEFNGITASHNITGDTLQLSGDQSFVFGLWNHQFNGGTWIEASYASMAYPGIPDIYDIVFQFNNPGTGLEETVVLAVDVTPVPLPGAAWLFLVGGAGIRMAVRQRR